MIERGLSRNPMHHRRIRAEYGLDAAGTHRALARWVRFKATLAPDSRSATRRLSVADRLDSIALNLESC